MKKIPITLACSFMCILCFGQTEQYKQGQVDLNAGVGFITPLFAVSNHTIKTGRAPITFTMDYAVSDEFSLGIYVASAKSDVFGKITNYYTGSSYYGKQSTLEHSLIGGRLFYHFELGSRLDTYSGGMLAYNYVNETAEANIQLVGKTETKALTYSFLIGGRCRFGKHFGVFLELGYGVTLINTGLNLKL